MSKPPMMTRGDREIRRERIVLAYRQGERAEDIAARFGLTSRYVRQCVKDAGFAKRPGAPAIWPDCPPDLRRQYLYARRYIGSVAAREQLERLAA